MKILLISPLCPLPLEKGGAIRIWNIAKNLSRNNIVDLVCFIRNEEERQYENELKKVFREVKFIERRKLIDSQNLLVSAGNIIRFFKVNLKLLIQVLFSNSPLLSILYDSGEMRNYLLKCDKQQFYDIFYSETFYVLASVRKVINQIKTKIVLIEQNIESALYQRQVNSQANLVLRMLMHWDVKKLIKEEKFFWNEVDIIGGLSEMDCKKINKVTQKRVLCVPNGVDISFFDEVQMGRVKDEVLFVGNMNYIGNTTAVKWLVSEIWPLIIKNKPALKLHIVGRGATPELNDFVQQRGFKIDSGVDDIRFVFKNATMLLAPINVGSGTKYKVLEAMGCKMPIVTTSIGAEGLDVISGTELLIANNSEDIAQTVLSLLNSEKSQEQLGQNGYNFVKKRYNWPVIVSEYESELKSLLV